MPTPNSTKYKRYNAIQYFLGNSFVKPHRAMIHYLTDHGYIKKENGIYAVTSIGTDWANALKEMFPKPITQNHERQTA